MTYDIIIGGKDVDYSFVENDLYRSVLQNLAVLYSTKKGTVPLYREFGLEMKFVDKPMEVAKVLLMNDVIEATKKYEPRANVVSVRFESGKEINGTAVPIVEVSIIE